MSPNSSLCLGYVLANSVVDDCSENILKTFSVKSNSRIVVAKHSVQWKQKPVIWTSQKSFTVVLFEVLIIIPQAV